MKSHCRFHSRGMAFTMVVCTALLSARVAHGWETVKFAESPTVIRPAVTYVAQTPVIDGALDAILKDLPIRRFTMAEKSSPDNPEVALTYRLAYGAQFLYAYIEVEASEIAYRDRAYQNGDGFTLVLTHPAPGNAPSREFYVLACSAVNKPSMEWTRNVFWYYNVDSLFTPTSDDTKTAFLDGDGTITFELLLPWKDVHPYHPWLSDAIGFNLAVAKAIGEKEVSSYRVVDAGIGSENSPREYALLEFEPPKPVGDPQTFVRLDRNSIPEGDTLRGRAVTVASEPGTERLIVFTQAGEKATIDQTVVVYTYGPGLTFETFDVKSGDLPPGGYVVKWLSRITKAKGDSGFSILPAFDPGALKRRLDRARDALSPGSYTTLEFTIEEVISALQKLHPYETAASARIRISQTLDSIEKAEAGSDPLAAQRGFVRRAYRSKLDDTLQPYTLWIPEDFDPRRKYPLLVFLHGSASTESDIKGWKKVIPPGFLALGPRGRGPSNFYSWDHAQADIAEAVDSVKENYPVDDRNILLAGFSMGGYGVYRTYYETPGTFRAIAVFSGMPRIGFRPKVQQDAKIVDFTQPENRKVFKGVPIFVYHGKRDLNVPYPDTERFVEGLQQAGVSVQFCTEADKGHEGPSDETIGAYFKWVHSVLLK